MARRGGRPVFLESRPGVDRDWGLAGIRDVSLDSMSVKMKNPFVKGTQDWRRFQGVLRSMEAASQLHAKKGTIYEKWKRGVAKYRAATKGWKI